MESDPLINIELIEAWHEGKLDEAGKARVSNLLEIDSQFREEFDLYHTLVAGIKNQKVDEIKRQLQEIDKELDRTSENKFHNFKVRKLFGMSLSIAAACVVLIIGISTWIYYVKFGKEAILTQYYVEDPGLPVFMSYESNKEFDEAMNLYKLKDYKQSLAALNVLLLSDPANDTLLYYSGINLLKLDKPDAAEVFFKHVFEIPNSEFRNDARYRQIICMWLLGRKEEAIIALKEISPTEDGNGYWESLNNIIIKN